LPKNNAKNISYIGKKISESITSSLQIHTIMVIECDSQIL